MGPQCSHLGASMVVLLLDLHRMQNIEIARWFWQYVAPVNVCMHYHMQQLLQIHGQQ